MKVHAFRRLPTEKFDVDFHGQTLSFAAIKGGDVVCEMDDETGAALIAAAPCGYREHQRAAAPAQRPPEQVDRPTVIESLKAQSSESDPPGEKTSAISQPADGGAGAPTDGPFVITSPNGQKFDLGAMDDAQVRDFAVEAGLAKPHHSKKGDNLRAFVIESLKAQ